MDEKEERRDLSRLNLEAARAAKVASSYQLMAKVLDAGQALLGEAAWQEEPELCVELSLERLLARYLLREFDDVEAAALALLARPLPVLARLSVEELRIRCCAVTGAYARGRELGLALLAERSETVPKTEEACLRAYLEEVAELDRWYERTPDAFDRMPPSSSPEQVAMDALMEQTILCAAWSGRPMLTALSLVRRVSELRRRGSVVPTSPYMIGALAEVSSATTGAYRRAARWVEPAARTAKRTASAKLGQCLCYQGMYATYSNPAERSGTLYEEAIATGLKSGSSEATSWGLLCELVYCYAWCGLPLGQVEAQRKARFGLMQRAGDAFGKHGFELHACWCKLLVDPGGATRLLESEPLLRNSGTFVAEQDSFWAEFARTVEAHLFLIAGAPLRALARAREAEAFRPAIYGIPTVTDIPLWLALAAAKCWDEEPDPRERRTLYDHLEQGVARFHDFAEGCRENFGHKLRLLEAELARTQGRTDDALAAYGDAAELARKHRFLHIEALSYQLAAEFHLRARRKHDGAIYLREACNAYARWGALAVVAHLEAKHPALLEASVWSSPVRHEPSTEVTTTSAAGEAQVDIATALRAAQAISGELDPTRVVAELMALVLENAGAQRGALLLCRGEALVVVARLSAMGTRIEPGLLEPLAEARGVATRVAQYAARTQEPAVLGDALTDPRFRDDPHLQGGDARSVLAMPLVHQRRLGGVLYLEHARPEAFSAARVAFLSVLTAQAAIALENASLYAERQRGEVGARFLAEASRKLVASLDFDETVRHIAEIPVPELCDACVVCLSDEAAQLVPVATVGLPEATAGPLCGALLGAPPTVFERALPIPVTDSANEKALEALSLPFRIGAPLATRGRGFGLVCFLSREPWRYGDSMFALSEELARRAAVALDHARLHGALQQALQMRDDFLTVASHELKTPLTSLSLQAQQLEQRAIRGEPGCSMPETRAFALFRRQLGRLNTLVDQMLDLSLIQGGRLHLQHEACDFSCLVQDVLARFECQLAQARCPVTLRAGSAWGRWDRLRIEQVISTLLANAIKYGTNAPISISVELQGPALELRVKDHGIGISSDDQRRIFERFERVESMRHHQRGLGLGLYIARHVVLAHGGTIGVESEPGHGACFVVRLPLQGDKPGAALLPVAPITELGVVPPLRR
jgi:signal transduction histidine kinase